MGLFTDDEIAMAAPVPGLSVLMELLDDTQEERRLAHRDRLMSELFAALDASNDVQRYGAIQRLVSEWALRVAASKEKRRNDK